MKANNAKGLSNKNLKIMLMFLLADFVTFFFAFVCAFLIDAVNIGVEHNASFAQVMLLAIPCVMTTMLLMYVGKIYNILWQYAGTTDILRLMLVAMTSLTMGLVYRGLYALIGKASASFTSVHASLVIIAYILFFLLITSYRMARKLLVAIKLRNTAKSPLNKVIIYGAGYTGAVTIKRMQHNQQDGYLPVAIIDDDETKKDKLIEGVKVVGNRDSIGEVIKKYEADVIAICITNLSKRELRSIFDYIKQFDVRIMIVSTMKDVSSEINSDVISIRSIKIEDLLHRDEYTTNRTLVDKIIKDKTVMVTGGAGSIGSELCRQALIYGCKRLVIFDQNESGMFEFNEELKKIYPKERYYLEVGTVRDRQKLREVMERHKPEIVFHAAAYKHVPMMEISADEAIKNNIFGTKNVIEQCDESGVGKFVLISTDKAINPASVMGATKRCAELCLRSLSARTKTVLSAVRFGNVLGSSGSVIPTFIKQINEGGPVTVTDKDMKRYFMTIPEAVRLVLQAGALAAGGEVFVLDMGDPVYIYDLASDLIRMSGLVPNKDIEIKITGLRPGEKLFEELLYGDENTDKTTHKDIFVCKLAEIDSGSVEAKLAEMLDVASKGDKAGSEDLLFKLVPSEYRNINKNKNARV